MNSNAQKSIVSPIGLDIKIVTPDMRKNVIINIHLVPKDKKFSKTLIFTTKLSNSVLYGEFINSLFEDLHEGFIENIKNFHYYNILLERLFAKFSHYYQNNHIYDFIMNQGENVYFMIPKSFRTYHFISKNKVSFVLELYENNKVKIYCKTTHLNYSNKLHRI